MLPLPKATVPFDREREEVVSHFAISFFLFEPGQEPDWSATVEATGEVADANDLLRRLARAAMDTLGASAEREFVLSCQDDVDEEGGLCLP